ncbi:MAG: hypothetical protein RLZZ488_337 [Pseudomonadota bacterium]|jgi:2-amino-4-hydroxy-6-hydroxymethyldihydropteridine diphosphokinase
MVSNLFVYLIAFGGNTGDRVQNAHGSLLRLQKFGRILRQTAWNLTAPLKSEKYPTESQEEYLNFVFEFETALEPQELYSEIVTIEDHFGHNRIQRWQPRAVDLDLLFFCRSACSGSEFNADRSVHFISPDGNLRVPHPEIFNRAFLLDMIEAGLQIRQEKLLQIKQTSHIGIESR